MATARGFGRAAAGARAARGALAGTCRAASWLPGTDRPAYLDGSTPG